MENISNIINMYEKFFTETTSKRRMSQFFGTLSLNYNASREVRYCKFHKIQWSDNHFSEEDEQ